MNVNKVIVCGRLGADPESKGPAVKLRIATTEKWTDKAGQKQERTEWHSVVFFGKAGEVIARYCHKGDEIYVEGSLRTSSYEKNGEKRYSTEIVGRDFQFGSKGKGGSPGGFADTVEEPPIAGHIRDAFGVGDDSVPF